MINSGFYNKNEILKIIEEEFINEDISLSDIKAIISPKFDEKSKTENNWKKQLILINSKLVLIN